MKRFLPGLGALALVAAIIGYVVWQRPAAPVPLPPAPKEVVLQYADGSRLWSSADGQPNSVIVERVLAELHGANLPLDALKLVGGAVRTTIDARTQTVSATVVGRLVAPNQRLSATVTAVDPVSGGVRAYVPGPRRGLNDPADEPRETVPELAEPFALADAPDLVQARMRPLDLTAAYATFAAGGVQRRAHFVAAVTGADGSSLYQAAETDKSVFGDDVADRITLELKEKPGCNSVACVPDAFPWAVGYTPQLAVTVLVDQAGGDVDAGLSVAIWQELVAELTE
ncbi:hypothetical protein [Lentzea aerocolonigenes]|uniref:hypothetical protein n=1 Tax=Lentzea aerocolonigenes TaxID=68170 RepID=UPI0004C3319A|nr:hypothetical protein [Lentzea aerocolonigenes]MCP2250292.1 hypothetical protein [Lentzea aerocolonigenes]